MNQKKSTPGILTYAPAPSSRERIKMPYGVATPSGPHNCYE